MTKEKYLEDLKDIKSIMERSSRFISLSGISGVLAGCLALIGAYLAYQTVYFDQNYLSYRKAILNQQTVLTLIGIASGVLILSIVSGIYFTQKKARKHNQKLWDSQSRRLIVNLAIPLIAGGTLCIILLFKGFIGLIAPLTLLFYGLALVNASKFTLSDIRSLGILEILLGLFGCQFIGYGLILWAVGFGVLHIIYGIVMHVKYGS
ncbi:hypothetical protein [Marinoscillum sp. MHG1-6]|uniref:hypothetical protein n=1 Tax=Marinoscillum sp. MHG1-6 TaxID=2959627 RepID=UPI0021589ED2|nr:hypothetical protein [Marinoscillum sp. MHG1-6]